MNYNPPWALSSPGWRLFNDEYKRVAPIRYWFTHTFRYKTILPIKWKYNKICDWIRYRTYDKYHIVSTGLEPGYYDKDHLMLNVNFNLLKDFVEIECASREYWSSDEPKSFFAKHVPFYNIIVSFRRPDLGIKMLEWETTLDDPTLPPHQQCVHQAIHAREVLSLYKWWVKERPSRVEISPSSALPPEVDPFDQYDRNTPEGKLYSDLMDKSFKQEEEWHNEDTENLIRLMKIRRGLWT